MTSLTSRLGEPPLDTNDTSPSPGALPNPLSEREMDVARLLATGASNTEIARDLIISPHTVKVHLRNIFEKLQVSSRTEATMALVQNGWIEVAGAVRSEEGATEPAYIPREPEPLANLPARPLAWQRIWMVVALVLTLAIFLAPRLWQEPSDSAPLLSDVSAAGGSVAPVNLDARWEALAPMPQARSRHAVARVGSNLYALGGEGEGGTILDSVVGFDLRVNRWRTLASLPHPASNLAAATVDGKIYVAGGTLEQDGEGGESVINPELWRFDPVENDWSVLGALPAAVAGATLSAARFNGEDALVLAGGWDGSAMRDEVWLLPVAGTSVVSASVVSASTDAPITDAPATDAPATDAPTTDAPATDAPATDAPTTDAPATDALNTAFTSPLLSPNSSARWQLLTRLPIARAFMGAEVVGDDLFVVGGFDGKAELANADAYNLLSGQWRELPPLRTARSGLALVFDDVALNALGGGWLESIETNERFDLSTETWTTFASPVAGSWRHLGAASADGALYLLGGWNGDYMDLDIAYQSTFRSLLPVITNP